MKHFSLIIFFLLLGFWLKAQKNDLSLNCVNTMNEERLTKINTFGLGYFRNINNKFRLGLQLDYVVNKYSYFIFGSSSLNTFSFSHTDKVRILSVDVLGKSILKKKRNSSFEIEYGFTIHNYRITNVPLLEIIDYSIVNQTIKTYNKPYFFPKIGLNVQQRIDKSLFIGFEIYSRHTFFYKDKILYKNINISTTTDNSSSGWSYFDVKIADYYGINISLNYKF